MDGKDHHTGFHASIVMKRDINGASAFFPITVKSVVPSLIIANITLRKNWTREGSLFHQAAYHPMKRVVLSARTVRHKSNVEGHPMKDHREENLICTINNNGLFVTRWWSRRVESYEAGGSRKERRVNHYCGDLYALLPRTRFCIGICNCSDSAFDRPDNLLQTRSPRHHWKL